jgi:lambda repressor-like predicted transcriptional regulator
MLRRFPPPSPDPTVPVPGKPGRPQADPAWRATRAYSREVLKRRGMDVRRLSRETGINVVVLGTVLDHNHTPAPETVAALEVWRARDVIEREREALIAKARRKRHRTPLSTPAVAEAIGITLPALDALLGGRLASEAVAELVAAWVDG